MKLDSLSMLLALLTLPAALLAAEENAPAVADFTLQDFHGASYSLSDFDEPIVVIAFLGTECPLAKLYGPRLDALAGRYQGRGVAVLGINSNSQDSITEMAAYARIHEIGYPLLKDTGNQVADQLGAQRTPEVFVLDAQRRIRYRGRIDDQYGVGYIREAPTRNDLEDALEDLLAASPVAQPRTEAVGCYIGRIREPQPESHVTYSNQIARVFQKHCVECHRNGEIAPFALTEYDEVAGWADTIAEVIRDQRMPPWHANSEHVNFANSRLMSDEEKELVYQWVRAGAPQGDPNQLPEPRQFVSGWRLPQQPEMVIPMRDRPFDVPAQGIVEYQYFVVDPGFTEDKWVQAAEIIPGNRSVVHHGIVFFRAPEGVRQRGLGWLTAYVPGQSTMELGLGRARRVPAGSKLIFQMHYTPAGSPQQDLTRLGLVFADRESVREEVVTTIAINRDFEIPPHSENYLVEAEVQRVPEGSRLLAIAPHMHLRGRSFHVSMARGDSTSVLLDVPRYDFNWQHAYRLAEPLPLDDNVQLECRARFDNSESNLVNPDPSVTVRWGDQTWEEMMIAFFEVAVPVGGSIEYEQEQPLSAAEQQRAEQTAERLMERFDSNRDGQLDKKEVPDSFAVFAFDRMDADGDELVSRDEALEAAKKSVRRRRESER